MPEVVDRLQTALTDRYRIEREIGAGGMATVYLAQDLRHDRKVALKLLRPELSAVIGAERFLAEIKLTANLQHPHILPLFDSGAADGLLFYVMPFIEGESLRDRLSREKQLPVADAVRLAGQVASALDYAHRHQVVHRDIKPENILLHDGSALVADFGIALAASKAGGSRMTETGMSLGTPHYMSPEQAMGEREITARSDVYALGAMLYEMLTGDPPFTGSTAQAVVARVLTESPRPMLPQRHTIPPAVEAAVLTALEKLPADRFGSAAEFAEALTGRNYAPTVPTPAAVPVAGRRPRRRRRRDPVTLALAGVAAGGHGGRTLELAPARTGAHGQPVQPLPAAGRGAPVRSRSRATGWRSRRTGSDWCTSVPRSAAASSGSGSTTSSTRLRSPAPRVRARRSSRPTAATSDIWSTGTKLRTVSLDGGPVLTLTDSANSTGGDWGPDGYVYFEVDSGIARKPASGGAHRAPLQRGDAQGSRRGVAGAAAGRQGHRLPHPARKPGGRRIPDRGDEAAARRARRSSCVACTRGTPRVGTCWS